MKFLHTIGDNIFIFSRGHCQCQIWIIASKLIHWHIVWIFVVYTVLWQQKFPGFFDRVRVRWMNDQARIIRYFELNSLIKKYLMMFIKTYFMSFVTPFGNVCHSRVLLKTWIFYQRPCVSKMWSQSAWSTEPSQSTNWTFPEHCMYWMFNGALQAARRCSYSTFPHDKLTPPKWKRMNFQSSAIQSACIYAQSNLNILFLPSVKPPAFIFFTLCVFGCLCDFSILIKHQS